MLDFFKDYKWDNRPFIVTGKGPSFRVPTEQEYAEYNVLSLNESARECKVDLAQLIDLDVLDRLGEKLYENAKAVVIPYYCHLGWAPNPNITLDSISRVHPVLSRMRAEGRLYGYNLSTASVMFGRVWNDSPVVWASFFSAESAVNLLGKLGVKRIRTLGVDGGKGQASAFSDLQNINKDGYDKEWVGIRKSIRKYSLDYAPLGVESPIRIFVGAGEKQIVPALVLKHSILKHATMSVDVTIMNDWTHPMPRDPRNWPRTPFSFQRFMIPEKCGYKGHAIYMDSDMLVFADVKEIWQAQSDKPILAMRNDDIDKHKAKYSVYKVDCSWALAGEIDNIIFSLDNGTYTYEDLVFSLQPYQVIGQQGNFVDGYIESGWNPDWNSLEEYTEGKTKLLHYTVMGSQPWWANAEHPLGYLWFQELKESVSDGSIPKELIIEHVNKKWLLKKCLEAIA